MLASLADDHSAFAEKVRENARAGCRTPFFTTVREHGKLYNEYRRSLERKFTNR